MDLDFNQTDKQSNEEPRLWKNEMLLNPGLWNSSIFKEKKASLIF